MLNVITFAGGFFQIEPVGERDFIIDLPNNMQVRDQEAFSLAEQQLSFNLPAFFPRNDERTFHGPEFVLLYTVNPKSEGPIVNLLSVRSFVQMQTFHEYIINSEAFRKVCLLNSEQSIKECSSASFKSGVQAFAEFLKATKNISIAD